MKYCVVILLLLLLLNTEFILCDKCHCPAETPDGTPLPQKTYDSNDCKTEYYTNRYKTCKGTSAQFEFHKPVDLLVHAEMYPGTVCMSLNPSLCYECSTLDGDGRCVSGVTTRKQSRVGFQIHGLWPKLKTGEDNQPTFCYNSAEQRKVVVKKKGKFKVPLGPEDENAQVPRDKTYLHAVNHKSDKVFEGFDNDNEYEKVFNQVSKFWYAPDGQYVKHGSCLRHRYNVSATQYIRLGLQIHNSLRFYDKLQRKKNVNAGAVKISVSELKDILSITVGNKKILPAISCTKAKYPSNDPNMQLPMLWEVWSCLDISAKLFKNKKLDELDKTQLSFIRDCEANGSKFKQFLQTRKHDYGSLNRAGSDSDYYGRKPFYFRKIDDPLSLADEYNYTEVQNGLTGLAKARERDLVNYAVIVDRAKSGEVKFESNRKHLKKSGRIYADSSKWATSALESDVISYPGHPSTFNCGSEIILPKFEAHYLKNKQEVSVTSRIKQKLNEKNQQKNDNRKKSSSQKSLQKKNSLN